MCESEKYDERYTISITYKKHYSRIVYYKVWSYIADHLTKSDKILDLGCGPGHLAQMLHDRGFKNYVGIDFSNVAIQMAKSKVPSFTFICADLNYIDFSVYDDFKFVSTECFEHLKSDIQLIERLPKNNIIFSVPRSKAKFHYRTYKTEAFIRDYYKEVLNISCVTRIKITTTKALFIVEATIL